MLNLLVRFTGTLFIDRNLYRSNLPVLFMVNLHKTWILCSIIFVFLIRFHLTIFFGEEKFSALPFKNKVVDEKKLVQVANFYQPLWFEKATRLIFLLQKYREMKAGQNDNQDITKVFYRFVSRFYKKSKVPFLSTKKLVNLIDKNL